MSRWTVLCLEYVLVHELTHMLERTHNSHFAALMDQFMPQWREYRELLNTGPLTYEGWSCKSQSGMNATD